MTFVANCLQSYSRGPTSGWSLVCTYNLSSRGTRQYSRKISGQNCQTPVCHSCLTCKSVTKKMITSTFALDIYSDFVCSLFFSNLWGRTANGRGDSDQSELPGILSTKQRVCMANNRPCRLFGRVNFSFVPGDLCVWDIWGFWQN